MQSVDLDHLSPGVITRDKRTVSSKIYIYLIVAWGFSKSSGVKKNLKSRQVVVIYSNKKNFDWSLLMFC